MVLKDVFFDIPYFFIKFRYLLHDGFKVEKELISNHIPSSSKVLDFGCGTGQYATLFNNDSYIGVDLEGPHLEYAIKKFPGKKFVIFQNNFNVPLKSSLFDWVISTAVVHHIPPSGEVMFKKEILRLLKPKGKILLIDVWPIEYQKTLIARVLVSNDRGHFQRTAKETIELFGKEFEVEKELSMRSGRYFIYALILRKQ